MKTKWMGAMFILMMTEVFGQNPLDSPKGLICDRNTAIKIAEAILFPIYGEKRIRSQRPYHVELDDGRWYVTGNVPDKRTNNDISVFGGPFHITLSKKDARVLDIEYQE